MTGPLDDQIRAVDRAAVGAIEQAFGPVVARHCHYDDGVTLVAEAGGVVGVLALVWRRHEIGGAAFEEAFVDVIEVAQACRRRGFARALLARAERLARARGCHQLRAWSSEDKVAALAMWQALGYGLVPAEVGAPGGTVRGCYAVRMVSGAASMSP